MAVCVGRGEAAGALFRNEPLAAVDALFLVLALHRDLVVRECVCVRERERERDSVCERG